MKKLLIALLCLSLFPVAAVADNGWGLFGSYWSPSDGDAAFGPGVRFVYETIPGVQFDLRLSYFDNVMDDDVPDLEVVPLEAGLSLMAPVADRLNLYGGLGVGYYFMDIDTEDDPDVDDEIGFFVNGGLAYDVVKDDAEYGGSRACLFAEAMYRSVKTDGPDGLWDADLDGLVLNAGLTVRW